MFWIISGVFTLIIKLVNTTKMYSSVSSTYVVHDVAVASMVDGVTQPADAITSIVGVFCLDLGIGVLHPVSLDLVPCALLVSEDSSNYYSVLYVISTFQF